MARKPKAGRTPSPEGRVPLNLTVPPYVAERLKTSGNASAAVKALVDADIAREAQMSDSKLYPGPFWIQRRDTGQYVVVKGSDYSYTTTKSGATEFGRYEIASKKFDKVGLDTATHCIIPSRDID